MSFSVPGTDFCWRMSNPQGQMRLEELGKMKK
jgi:hypothetical protein